MEETNKLQSRVGGARPKFDYDGDDFYDDIFAAAMQGMKDCEIADKLGLDPETFSCMKNGNYIGWNEEQNERRGARILKVLTRARRSINAIVRGRYLKAALGGIKIKSKSTTHKKLRINGSYTSDEEIMTTESETETAPNMQALATWMFHHDADWRKVQQLAKGEELEDDVKKSEDSLDIERWIEKENEVFGADGIGM